MNHNGFSLIEVLIALIVLSVGLMGTSKVMLSTMTSNNLNRQHTRATALVQDQIERLQRGGYAALVAGTTTEDYGTIAGQPQYKRITTVVDNSPVTNLRTVTVEMRWGGDKHRLASTTLLAQ
jgi:prepilin-type N-terminal cleavage/methylation domain-containing protein